MTDTTVAPRRLPFDVGTRMIFVQQTPPPQWTVDITTDDRFLRVVNTAGGGTGGPSSVTVSTPDHSLSHYHNIGSHNHGMGHLDGGHKHTFDHYHQTQTSSMSNPCTHSSRDYWMWDVSGGGWFQRITDSRHMRVSIDHEEQMHHHYCYDTGYQSVSYSGILYSSTGSTGSSTATGSESSTLSHDHSISGSWRPKYIDVVIGVLTG